MCTSICRAVRFLFNIYNLTSTTLFTRVFIFRSISAVCCAHVMVPFFLRARSARRLRRRALRARKKKGTITWAHGVRVQSCKNFFERFLEEQVRRARSRSDDGRRWVVNLQNVFLQSLTRRCLACRVHSIAWPGHQV